MTYKRSKDVLIEREKVLQLNLIFNIFQFSIYEEIFMHNAIVVIMQARCFQ